MYKKLGLTPQKHNGDVYKPRRQVREPGVAEMYTLLNNYKIEKCLQRGRGSKIPQIFLRGLYTPQYWYKGDRKKDRSKKAWKIKISQNKTEEINVLQ